MMKLIKFFITLLILICMGVLLAEQWSKIQSLDLRPDFALLSLATTGVVFIFFLDALGWHLILRALGHCPPVSLSINIWILSSLTRYLPGGIWGYASRIVLCRKLNIDLAAAGISLYLETLLLATSALAVGMPAVFAAGGALIDPPSMLLLLLIVGCLLHPKVIVLMRYLPGRAGQVFSSVRLPSMNKMLVLYSYYVLFWILFSAVFVVFVAAIYPLEDIPWIPVGTSLPMGFVAGLVVIFSPSGIGIRESVLYLLLLPHVPASASLLISISSRAWLTLAEGISAALSIIWARCSRGYSFFKA